jgi:hypothetical protein
MARVQPAWPSGRWCAVTSDNRGGPRKGRPDNTTTAAKRIAEDADSEQLVLWPDAIPAHRLHPAEADMRRVVNTMSRPKRRWVA